MSNHFSSSYDAGRSVRSALLLRRPRERGVADAHDFAPVGRCGADFAALLRKQYDDYGRVIRAAHIAAE